MQNYSTRYFDEIIAQSTPINATDNEKTGLLPVLAAFSKNFPEISKLY